MFQIEFDKEKLNRDDRKVYDLMTDSEREVFEKLWVSIETQKLKLFQRKNAAKERDRRERTVLAEKQRKERTRRLIERGAMLESRIPEAESKTNDEIMEILVGLFKDARPEQVDQEIRN